MRFPEGLFRTKSLDELIAETKRGDNQLRKALGPGNLIALGIGAIIGAGIFVLSGLGAHYAGPGLMLSFVLSGMGCAFAALCYAEFAAMIPLAGSAYTYAYATLGEMCDVLREVFGVYQETVVALCLPMASWEIWT